MSWLWRITVFQGNFSVQFVRLRSDWKDTCSRYLRQKCLSCNSEDNFHCSVSFYDVIDTHVQHVPNRTVNEKMCSGLYDFDCVRPLRCLVFLFERLRLVIRAVIKFYKRPSILVTLQTFSTGTLWHFVFVMYAFSGRLVNEESQYCRSETVNRFYKLTLFQRCHLYKPESHCNGLRLLRSCV